MLIVTEGPWQYMYTVEDETIYYRWRVLRMPVIPATDSSAVRATSPESGSVLAEGTALTKEAAERRAIHELTTIVGEARSST